MKCISFCVGVIQKNTHCSTCSFSPSLILTLFLLFNRLFLLFLFFHFTLKSIYTLLIVFAFVRSQSSVCTSIFWCIFTWYIEFNPKIRSEKKKKKKKTILQHNFKSKAIDGNYCNCCFLLLEFLLLFLILLFHHSFENNLWLVVSRICFKLTLLLSFI